MHVANTSCEVAGFDLYGVETDADPQKGHISRIKMEDLHTYNNSVQQRHYV